MTTSFGKIVPCLWFDDQGEEAANFYVSLFDDSRIVRITRYGNAGTEIHGRKPGSVMTVLFELNGQPFTALNGGPHFTFNEAISLQIMCETQEEIDRLWSKLSSVPEAEQCGWVKDRFGLSWQITPRILDEMVASSDPERADRVMAAMLGMKKLDIAALEKAFAG